MSVFQTPLEYGTRLRSSSALAGLALFVVCAATIWLIGSRNPYTPAGYVGYLEVKDILIPIGDSVLARIRAYAANSPFIITSVMVGNVQYAAEVADAVARKLAATQELQRKDTEIEIERKERTKREVQAQWGPCASTSHLGFHRVGSCACSCAYLTKTQRGSNV